METITPRGTESVLGRGIPEDPVRILYQYWDFKGNLLARYDTLKDNVI